MKPGSDGNMADPGFMYEVGALGVLPVLSGEELDGAAVLVGGDKIDALRKVDLKTVGDFGELHQLPSCHVEDACTGVCRSAAEADDSGIALDDERTVFFDT